LPQLRILIAHNRYQQKGGEDFVFENESKLLASKGHRIHLLQVDNDHIQGPLSQIQAAADCIYSVKSKRAMASAIAEFQPEIVHIHNLFPAMSTSVLQACSEAGVPYVRTVNNFRMICPKGILYRDGSVCEACVGKRFAWPGVAHACYRSSRAGTLVVALASLTDRRRVESGTAKQHYIVGLTEFGKNKLIEGHIPKAVYHVKPNFLFEDPGIGAGAGGYFAFVGRLVQEKGIETLLEAWRQECSGQRLKIAGTGPLSSACIEASAQNPNIEFLGQLARDQTTDLIQNACAMIFPSVWYEGFPMSIVESLASGTPVIASKIGSMAHTLIHGQTGLHFVPGDASSLSEQVLRFSADTELQSRLRIGAREDYELKYTAEINYSRLIEIYETVIASYPN
jgi:glycosyltransferase involved in cell wall biosynthesis